MSRPCKECSSTDGAAYHDPTCNAVKPLRCDTCKRDWPMFQMFLSRDSGLGVRHTCPECAQRQVSLP